MCASSVATGVGMAGSFIGVVCGILSPLFLTGAGGYKIGQSLKNQTGRAGFVGSERVWDR